VQSEVDSLHHVQGRKRRERAQQRRSSSTGSAQAHAPVIFLCGLDHLALDIGRGLGHWWSGILRSIHGGNP
jgi:hypothetical protein